MSAPSREAIAVALLERLRALVGSKIKTYSRVYLDPNELQAEAQPALCLLADNYTTSKERGRPNVYQMNMMVVLYARAAERTAEAPSDETPETILNDLINSVENALERQANEPINDTSNPTDTNLGGLVSRASINGAIDLIPGEAGGQGAALVPVEMLVTKGN